MSAVSFVVPAYNEERFLPATLAAIHAAARECGLDYEVLVVDDASTDRTAEAAREGGARVVPVAYRQIARVRNAGARAASGARLFFVDADTRVGAAVLREALAALDAGAVGGGAMPLFEAQAPPWTHRMMAAVTALLRLLGLAAGCFVFCERRAFEAAGGFDERHFAGEELMLSVALRKLGRFVILRARVVTSPRKFGAMSFREFVPLGARLLLRGLRGVRRREGNEFWYDGRR